MRRLGVISRLLAAVLLALAIRVVVSGLNALIGLTAAVVVGLLVTCRILTRQGRRVEPTSHALVGRKEQLDHDVRRP